jgi:hypothetical protein
MYQMQGERGQDCKLESTQDNKLRVKTKHFVRKREKNPELPLMKISH